MRWIIVATLLLLLSAAKGVANDDAGCGHSGSPVAGIDIQLAERVAATDSLPAHCRVVARIPSAVNFELKLPLQWNGKFLMVGNGGYLGAFFDQSYGLARGYATVSTDTGHTGPGPEFAFDNRGAEIDFAYRAVHVTAVAAKKLVRQHYGKAPGYSYFRGCSTGGRQGLIEAQRFPEDFDGWSIGAPIYDYTQKQLYNAAWVAKAMFGNDMAGYVRYEKLRILGAAVYRNCDALDGLRDGIIDDPRRCTFNAQRDLPRCPISTDTNECFTSAQIDAIAKIYAGPGAELYPGHVPGGEWLDGPPYVVRGGWDTYITGILDPPGDAVNTVGQMSRDPYGGDKFEPVQLRNAQSFFRYFVFEPDRPDYDVLLDLDFEHLPDVTRTAQLMDATDSKLESVRAASKRILLWHGWADVGLNPLRTIRYYETLVENSGKQTAGDFVRLFMVPGMYHCEGGPGPDIFDDLTALERWVEQGDAPEQMVAYKTRTANGFYPDRAPRNRQQRHREVVRSRPLCRYPLVARYRGSGSIDYVQNFQCVQP